MFKTFTKIYCDINKFNLLNNVVQKRFAGHSKWQNIRHIKAAKDAEKSNMFSKLSRQIKVAVAEGGSIDPKMNLKLEYVLDQARRFNMPSATVQNILKSIQTNKDKSQLHMVEIKGPGSCIVLCEVFTDHLHQLKMSIASILKKHKARYTDGGGIHLFEEKGLIYTEVLPADKEKTPEDILEAATEHAIESGAEDVQLVEDDILEFTCGASSLRNVRTGLENLKYNITSASVEYIPIKLQPLSDEDKELCSKLFEKLESISEVVRLSDNIA